jgi:hypothetical protein
MTVKQLTKINLSTLTLNDKGIPKMSIDRRKWVLGASSLLMAKTLMAQPGGSVQSAVHEAFTLSRV